MCDEMIRPLIKNEKDSDFFFFSNLLYLLSILKFFFGRISSRAERLGELKK